MSLATAATSSKLRAESRSLGVATCFLTRLPLGRRLHVEGNDLADAAPAFPLVGAGVGALVGVVALLAARAIGAWPAAALALLVGAVLTGAFHLDGLADSVDGLAGRTRGQALEIMRDHRAGSYGVVAIVLDLLLKGSALSELASHTAVIGATLAAGALSRAVPVALAATLPYARTGPGLGSQLTNVGYPRAAATAMLAVTVAVASRGVQAALAAAIVVVLVALLHLFYRRWIGGVTGDLLGASIEVTEVAVLLTIVALQRS